MALQRQTWTAWLLLALGVGAWAGGQAGWTVYEVLLHITPSSPSLLDALFLSSSALVIVGLLAMVRTPAGHLSHVRGGTEALFLAAGFALFSWTLIGHAVLASTGSPFAEAIELAYPVLDATALAAVLFVALYRSGDPPAGLGLLGVGIASLAISDSAFWYLNNVSTLPGATPLDGGWVAGFLLIAFAALRDRGAGHRRRRLVRSPALSSLPALPTVAGMLVIGVDWLRYGELHSPQELMGILSVVVILSVALLLIVSYENRALTGDLQRRVEERTAKLHASESQLRDRTLQDSLTGLANRTLLADRATQALERARRSGALVAVMVMDLDTFKLVNDRFGHSAGDQLLHDVAERLQKVVRPQDTVARIGGDEFVVLVDAVEKVDDALVLAERLHEAMRPAFSVADSSYELTVSIGVAVDSLPHSNFEQLLSDADVAMYAVKSGGRDAVQLFHSGMHEQTRERFQLQSELREGIERGEFWLLYQPAFDCEGRHLEGFEALLRWNSPKRGLVSPDRFIPLAEELGLIVPLGRWVLEEALAQAATWDRIAGEMHAPRIAVNVSTVQLGSPSLVADVKAALNRSGIDPSRVVIEITESALIDSSSRVVNVMHALKALGVSLAIDDFGTGYASISYLQNIPADILKVDRSFVVGSQEGKRGRELLRAIVNIGQVLALATIAEGVEQRTQLMTVRQAGCDFVQGNLFSRPLPPEGVQRVIAQCAGRETALAYAAQPA